jgi:predicted amidohydrolase YtcJ
MTTRLHNVRSIETGAPVELFAQEGRWSERSPNVDREIDGLGRFVAPPFVDCHCHVLPTGLDLSKVNLDACNSHQDVLDVIAGALRDVRNGWLLAVRYDQTRYDGKHLTLRELDAVSPSVPILLRHVSGHASVANSAALIAAEVGEDVQDPPGGEFVREADGRLTGVLLESAHEFVSERTPAPDLDGMIDAIRLACESMSEMGIVAACDMMTGRFDLVQELLAYDAVLASGSVVDTVLYVQWREVFGSRGIGAARFADCVRDLRHARLGGVKLFADGAIGSGTAAIHGRYEGGTGAGKLIYPPDELTRRVLTAHDAGYSVAVHAIGDRAVDVVMDAFEATGEPQLHRLEHAMLLSDAQIERIARAGCTVTFQPEFLLRFGHSYRRQLGPERTALLKRSRSVVSAGVPLAYSSDRPIVPGNPMHGVNTAATRPDGFSQAESVTRDEAFHLYTKAAAVASGMHDLGLRVGDRAKAALFDRNPIHDPEATVAQLISLD